MAIQKREYELSIWHESLDPVKNNKLEEKLAVIGAHDMTYLGRATGGRLITNLNGTHTLTFQMADKWFDSEVGDYVENEFKDFVVNENKVKLFYKGEWLEFFIKSCKLVKHYKGFVYEYSCSDAFIDELSRNGYNITFDTELYNNVEEIGVFSDEILEDSIWSYCPENNWGDFTEFLEEKLFKIPVSYFSQLSGYKLNFEIPQEENVIINTKTKEKRNLELGDDLARVKGYFWDCQDSDKNVELLGDKVEIPNDGYIYVPYSQLSFCYVDSEGKDTYEATEEPATKDEQYYIAPSTINPKALIQFIAIPRGSSVNIDESGLIINKDYSYIMTVEDWNNSISTKEWYLFEDVNKKEVTDEDNGTNKFYGNKCITYDGYLDIINDVEVENGKKFSISNRTEINISEEIDQYVEVYNNKASEYEGLYSSDEWCGDLTPVELNNYRVCSKIATRQIVPQLARNYFQNGVNIQSKSGWEVMVVPETMANGTDMAAAQVSLLFDKNNNDENNREIQKSYLSFTPSNNIQDYNENYDTIINFGAIGQEKTIIKDKVYCFGIKFKEYEDKDKEEHISIPTNVNFVISEGSALSQGNYTLTGEKITIPAQNNAFYLIKSNHNIENPYLCLQSTQKYLLEEIWFFEAYTKGTDFFEDGTYRYSGRDIFYNWDGVTKDIGNKEEAQKQVLFETDIMAGATYEYKQYFIQQLHLKESDIAYDTFMAKSYLSADKYNKEKKRLPLNAAKYTEDDYEIITNYIDLNRCEFYKGNIANSKCDCSYNEDDDKEKPATKLCMYQKYGYCPYRFETEKHCRRVRTLTGSKSNRFNLTQELGKVFEVYPIYHIEHNDNGTVKTDDEGNQIKHLHFITENGVENKIGFRYEKNLSDITKTIDSNQIVTKLYVEDVDSELSKTGLCSIKTAEDNPSKDSFIIDLSYYIKQGMLSKDQVMADLYGTTVAGENEPESFAFLKQLGYYNTQYDKLTNKIINLQSASFTELEANLNVNLTGIETAQKELIKIRRYMDNYNHESDAYKNYIEKYQEQEAILIGLIQDTFYTDGICLDSDNNKVDSITPDNFINVDQTLKDIKDKWVDNHSYTLGILGQYNEQYKQIQEWKKERASYLKQINNLSSAFFKRYESYLKEGTWSDSNYLTDNAYYHDAVKIAAEGAIPKVSYDIRVVPLGALDEDYEFGTADTTYVEDIGMFGINEKTGLPNRLKVIISSLQEDLDVPTNDSIQVQNYTTQFEDLFQQVTASVQSLTLNENIYKRSSNFTSTQNIKVDSLQGTLDTNSLILLNTDENNITINAEGQSGSDINNHNNKYKQDGQGLFFSNNGGEIWNVGVGPNGINADYITTGNLDASRIRIVDGSYVYFLWDKSGITAYREPTKDDNQESGIDFARFNKYGLSLVEKNKIRLRAGYEYKWNDIVKEGDISQEKNSIEIGRRIGFYLYNDKGQPIFSTMANDNSDDKNNSARIDLTGEMYAKSQLETSTFDYYEYSGLYQFNDKPIYILGTSAELVEPIEVKEDIEVLQYEANAGAKIKIFNSYYTQNDKLYVLLNDVYYELSQQNYKWYDPDTKDETIQSKDISDNKETISFIKDGILQNQSFYIVNNKYYLNQQRYDKTEVTKADNIGVYINNTAINMDVAKNDKYFKRLFSCAKLQDGQIQNLVSILANGSLYIGGNINQSNGATIGSLAEMDNYINITDDGLGNSISLSDGKIYVGERNVLDYFKDQIDDLANQVANIGLVRHRHQVSSLDIVPKDNVNGQLTTLITTIFADGSVQIDNEEVTTSIDSSNDINNGWIAFQTSRPNRHIPFFGQDESYIKWVRVSEFFKMLQASGFTDYSGDNSTPGPVSSDEIVQKAYLVVKAHIDNRSVYSHIQYLKTTLDNKEINSRHDCSGLVDGIWQILGDAGTGYTYATYDMLQNMPRNWSAINVGYNKIMASMLQPGDVLLNPSAHVEFVSNISNGKVYTYAFGGGSYASGPLYNSYYNNNLQSDLGQFSHILRKDK